MSRIETISLGITLALSSGPAWAGPVGAPAPVAGIGVGAILLIGLGYRALKGRIGR